MIFSACRRLVRYGGGLLPNGFRGWVVSNNLIEFKSLQLSGVLSPVFIRPAEVAMVTEWRGVIHTEGYEDTAMAIITLRSGEGATVVGTHAEIVAKLHLKPYHGRFSPQSL